MSFNRVPSGENTPDDIYVIIEIPANSSPVKYEIDKGSDSIFVDRFMTAPMFYPANYGYINETLADDGDAVDVLVVSPYPVVPGSVIRCRPIGVLHMTDESGIDDKLVAVPHEKLSKEYQHVKEITDLPKLLISQITLFFETYKNLEEGKWVKVEEWADSAKAKQVIMEGVKMYEQAEGEYPQNG